MATFHGTFSAKPVPALLINVGQLSGREVRSISQRFNNWLCDQADPPGYVQQRKDTQTETAMSLHSSHTHTCTIDRVQFSCVYHEGSPLWERETDVASLSTYCHVGCQFTNSWAELANGTLSSTAAQSAQHRMTQIIGLFRPLFRRYYNHQLAMRVFKLNWIDCN